jgi:hypothetical protein
MATRQEWSNWFERAPEADPLEVTQRLLGARLEKVGASEWAGPCPLCGGEDRFSVNVQKKVFNCRSSAAGGGSPIDMVIHCTGCSLIEAAEAITGEPRPDQSRNETEEEQEARLRAHQRFIVAARKREEEQRRSHEEKQSRDERTIEEVLKRAVDLDDARAKHGQAYLMETRGLSPKPNLSHDIKYVGALDYYGYGDNGAGELKRLGTLPALVATIRNASGAVTGISQTYLDPSAPRKWTPIGSSRNRPRKIRGDKHGGMIRLGVIGETIGLSEGWENCLAWHQLGRGSEDVSLAAAVDLGNLSGRATGSIDHPSLTDPNSSSPLKIPNGEPDLTKSGVILPEGVKSVIIVADNDSEPFALHARYRTAVNRFCALGLQVSLDWPPPGSDWNDVLLHDTRGMPLPKDTKATEKTKALRHSGGVESAEEFLRRTDWILKSDRRSKNTTDVWPQPQPIDAPLKPVPAFDANILLPEALRAWVNDEAERMPCPLDFIASAAITALGSIVGARCAIKPKAHDPWLVVPNLWGGIVGDPSVKKSPAWSTALKPLDRLIAKAHDLQSAAMRGYETGRAVFSAQSDALEGRLKEAAKKPSKGDPLSIARELQELRDEAPKAPTLRRYKTNDTTVEKLGELLRENPGGLLVLRDELVGLIAAWEREGREGDRAFFLEAWNGNQSFDVDRIGRGHTSIPNVCASIFGGIQPDKLTMYLEQAANSLANDGMLQRFQLLVYPDPRCWEWRDRAPNKAARDAAFAVFEKLSEFDPLKWGAAHADEFAKFPYFGFGDEAQRVFVKWSENLHRERIPKEDDLIVRQHLTKFDKLFPALALIFHLVDCVDRNVRGPVTAEAALRAAAWCEYLEAHARRCYGLLTDDGLRAAQTLAKKLERGALGDGFTARDVRRNQWRNLTTDETVQAALDWLEGGSWVRGEVTGGTGPGGGRRTIRYRIHPELRRGTGKGGA